MENKIQRGCRHKWTQQEDQSLRKFVEKTKKINWIQIAEILNKEFPDRFRLPKQCRDRYTNYSNFFMKKEETSRWEIYQIDILFSKFNLWGTSWSNISQALPEKSENAIKNKFYGEIRKTITKINMKAKLQNPQTKKMIRQDSCLRVIEAQFTLKSLPDKFKDESINIRKKLFDLITKGDSVFQNASAMQLINDINKFNFSTNNYKIVRERKKRMKVLQKQTKGNKKSITKQDSLTEIQQFSTVKIGRQQRKQNSPRFRLQSTKNTHRPLYQRSPSYKMENIGVSLLPELPYSKQKSVEPVPQLELELIQTPLHFYFPEQEHGIEDLSQIWDNYHRKYSDNIVDCPF